MYSLGEKLKELRVKRGLSQEELAEKINEQFNAAINKGMISKWENNIVEPRLDIARMLSIFFDISMDELLGIHKDKNEIHTIAAHHADEDWTEEEWAEIERFKEFVRSKRKNQE
jgi:transcriptional regulator with XRE-family HTH domain